MRRDVLAGVELELRLLGPLELRLAGEQIALGGAKPRALLADLVLHLGKVVSVDRLVDDLWGQDAPESAAHAVEVHVSQLRKALGPARPLLVTRVPGYVLELDPERVDLHRFARLVDEGRGEPDPADAASTFREALALWRGPALVDFVYEPFAQVEIARLEELRQMCLEGRIAADLALGRHADLAGELEALVAAEPLRERLRGLLMLALYRSGRQADALAAYREARETLVEELGIEPGPELRELEAAILRQDEALLAAAAPAAVTPGAPRKRKLVTVLFADVVDSMTLAETLDPEAYHAVLQRYFDAVEAVVARHGGTIEKFAGDAAMAAFGIPVTHEDDALRAARAALELQAAMAALELDVRVGVETGEVLSGDASSGQRFVTGHAVGVTARLEQAAAPGEVVVGETTARLIAHAARLEPLGPVELRGRKEPLAAFRLLEVAAAATAFERRLDAPLVGRERELVALREALAQAVAERKARAVLVVGPPGIGKSRLAVELTEGVDARVLTGRCLSYGEGITYWPLRTIVPERELGPILSAPSAGEIAWAFRRSCEDLAKERPLVLVLDDLHWGEPTFLELVEHLAERGTAPILAVCLAREELLEERPDFLPDSRIVLGPLEPDETETLVVRLLADRALDEDTRARIIEAAEGNPLFLEQLVAFVSEEGVLGAEKPLPGSIQALLAARLDRLGPGERAVLERAAIVGKEFSRSAIAGLLEPAAAGTVARHFQTLVSRGFFRPGGEEEFRFRHGLIQEAVYRTTPKEERAGLHERFADHLARGEGEELDELVGYHLERAYRLRAELGPADRALRQLAADAGARLGAAGIRAAKRNDIPAAVSLLGRSTALLPTDDGFRRELLCELGVASFSGGDPDGAEATLHEAIAASLSARDGRIALRARLEVGRIRLAGGSAQGSSALLDLAAKAIPTFETLNDHRSLGRAWLLVGFVEGGIRGRHSAWTEAAGEALIHYRGAGWPAATCLQQIAAALYHGPAHVDDAAARCEALLHEAPAGPAGEANIRLFLGGLEAMRGRFADARRLLTEATGVFEELGQLAAAAVFWGAVGGDIEFLARNYRAAETILQSACAALAGAHDRNSLSSRAADLAEAFYRQGDLEKAEEWVSTAKTHAASDDLSAQPLWRSVHAKTLARSGSFEEAEGLAREAVRLAGRTEALNRQARMLLDLVEVLTIAGKSEEAARHVEEAAALYDLKGNAVGARLARTLSAVSVPQTTESPLRGLSVRH